DCEKTLIKLNLARKNILLDLDDTILHNDFAEEIFPEYFNGSDPFKIKLNISNIDHPLYEGIDYEEFDANKKMKYFYKKGSANGPDKTPTSKITEIEKTFKNKIKNFFLKYSQIYKDQLTKDNKKLLKNIQNLINEKFDFILSDFKNFTDKHNFLKNQNEL
ncbi:TM1802 family CRISPR-associated protein, partial [Desulfurella sp.]|uniref:TM1802 family CRISPR-associated protein n=1 Tax=Desulfurella sp. TaxID=1962857 RepID=UPI0025C2F7CC